MVQTTHFELQEVFAADGQPGVFGKVATQLMLLHRQVSQRPHPTVLECGVHQGWSTGVLAHACEAQGGVLISLDIDDCADAIQSPVWTFIQTDDSARETVLTRAPILRQGIDLMYIDSLHDARHVARLIESYYPLVKQGGWLAFDDVDPGPYLRGRRKDNAEREIAWRGIGQAIQDFFYANEDDLFLEFHFGSTGLALMQKLVPQDHPHRPARAIRLRHTSLRSLAKRLLRRTHPPAPGYREEAI
ncbi:MAG: class I SAM-dependent methyltransferase [Anaerolineaceae bacterium]|nr:class I SAM-dependent methyltransferase [Anaerolineaceae bacterium]